nr:retrovirus-related Pol polyprotein from transposon TNT 1-94 [Tanacetum cinerariifolium]
MSRDVIGSTMRISLKYRGEYSQWRERLMNYLEEQTDGEATINSIPNGDQPFPVIAQVSLAGNAHNAPPTLKDPKFWTAEEKKTRKIDRLARSLLIQGLPNDIYSLIVSNKTAKDLWDALERQMRGSDYAEQNRKTAILSVVIRKTIQNQGDVNDALGYKKKAVVVISDPLALVAEKRNELKKITALLAKAFNRRKFYSKPTNNNLRTSSTSQSANKKQEFVKSDDKKDDEKMQDMSKVKCYNCKKEGHFAKDNKKAEEINANMVFMAQIKKVLSDSDESSSSAEETIGEDYGNLNASYVNEKINFSDDYFQEIINPDFEKIDSPFQQTSSLKLYVPIVILEKIIIDLEDEVVSLLEKEKANLKIIESLKSKVFESSENVIYESENQSENDCLVVEEKCDQVDNSKVIAPGMFKLNVKRYSRKDLLSCNNSHLGETSSAYVCNDAMNVSCNSRLCASFDENNLFIFDDESVRISPVSKMPFRKKPRDSMNARSKSNSNKYLPRAVHRWLPKMKPLAEPVAKWIPRIVQICLWIIDSGCSKHMTGNRALLTNFVEKFLGTVRFGNNDFAVIVGSEDMFIG